MTCDQCRIIRDELSEKLYEDDKVIAVLNPEPAAVGHALVMPKEHFPIIENVPDSLIGHTFAVANKISMAIFEALKMHGINIIVSNGIAAGQQSAHFMVHIIPRKEDDGLDFAWQPKQLSHEEMASIELKLKEHCADMMQTKHAQAEDAISGLKKEAGREKEATPKDKDAENYQLKHLVRMP